MCSSTRGPAIAPSLVTWPIEEHRRAGLLREAHQPRRGLAHLADRARRSDSSARSTASGSSRRRAPAAASPRRARGCVSTRGLREQLQRRRPARPSRARAQATCAQRFLAGDVERRQRRALSASAACSSSVDLPMPGSPPSSTTEPCTRPPPSTRSSSPMPGRHARLVALSDLRQPLRLAAGRGTARAAPACRVRLRSRAAASRRRRTSGTGPATAGFRCRTGRRRILRGISPWFSLRIGTRT